MMVMRHLVVGAAPQGDTRCSTPSRRHVYCQNAHQHTADAPTPQKPQSSSAIQRRAFLLTGAAYTVSCTCAHATTLRSVNSQTAAVLTVVNATLTVLKLFWLNFDGDSEYFVSVPAGATWTVDTYEGHPWRVVDAATGKTLQTYTATAGEQVLRIAATQGAEHLRESPSKRRPSSEAAPGFDGLGGVSSDYAPAKLADVLLSSGSTGQAVVLLDVEGYALPVSMFVGVPEAMAIVYSNGMDFRRPTTTSTWIRSLQSTGASVERVLVTRMVGTTYYARILLKLPDGSRRSIDSRPSDAMALALQSSTPLFVAKSVAQEFAEWAARMEPGPGSLPASLEAPRGEVGNGLRGPRSHSEGPMRLRQLEGERSM